MKYPQGDAEAKIRGDKRNLDYNVGVMQPIVLALDAAQALLDLPFAGDFLHVDSSSTGQISVKFDTAMAAGFPMKTNTMIKDFPYRRVLVSWAAQPGKTATLWYGYGVNIVPPNQDITSIGSIVNPIDLTAATIEAQLRAMDTRVAANEEFSGVQSRAASGAGQFNAYQIGNPVGSAKILYVESIDLFSGFVNGAQVRFQPPFALAPVSGSSKNASNAAPVASIGKMDQANNSAILGTLVYSMNQAKVYRFASPWRLVAGEAITVWDVAANAAGTVSFEWRERTV